MTACPGSRRGFTLIELIATIVVLAALGSVATSILVAATDGYISARTGAQLHSEASIALDRVVRELRKIPFDSGAGGVAPDIDLISSKAVTWETDSTIGLSGTELQFTDNGAAAVVLLADVTAFTIEAYDESNASLTLPLTGAACDPIRRLRLTVTLTRNGISHTLRTKLFLRGTMTGVEP